MSIALTDKDPMPFGKHKGSESVKKSHGESYAVKEQT